MAKWSIPDHSETKAKADYHFIYENQFYDTCYTTFQANDLNDAWEQFREEYNHDEIHVVMVFEGTVTTVHYQE